MQDIPGYHYNQHTRHHEPDDDYTLEIGDTDIHGNKHPDHDKYEAEMHKRYIGKDKPKIEFHDDLNEINDIPDLPF